MEREAGLARIQFILQVTDTTLAARQPPHDLQTGRFGQSLESSKDDIAVGWGTRRHAGEYINSG